MINPSVYTDVDGKYRGLDNNIHQAEGFTNYTIFSLWDTYRAEHPLLALMKIRARDGHDTFDSEYQNVSVRL
jgi:putative alpha-1,2-mannosidase